MQWTRKIPVPRGHGASFYDVGSVFSHNIRDLKLNERAAAISFNFLLAIPAFLIFLFSLIPYLPLESVQSTILNALHIISPNERFYQSVEHTIVDLMETKRKELVSFGILATIFVASNSVMGLIRSFDRKTTFLRERSSLKRRLRAIWLTVILMVMVIIAIALFILQTHLVKEYVLVYYSHPGLIRTLSLIFMLVTIFLTICFFYKFGPSLETKIPFFSSGAAIATLFLFLVSYLFFYFTNNFINYNKVYGSIGTLLMLMVWFFIIGLILLVGYEINIALEIIEADSQSPMITENEPMSEEVQSSKSKNN